MNRKVSTSIGFLLISLSLPVYAGNDWMPATQEMIRFAAEALNKEGWAAGIVFGGICGLLAYSLPGAIGFSIDLSTRMHTISVIKFDPGLIFGVMVAASIRWIALPILARQGILPTRKETRLF